MNIYNQAEFLSHLTMSNQKEEIDKWFTQEKVLDYIENEINDENIIINASFHNLFIHTVFIPNVNLDEETINSLLGWNLNPCNQWSYVISSHDIRVEHSLSAGGSNLFKEGEQIIFKRSFEGVPTKRNYYELNQKLSQVLDLHHMPERNAWCKLDSSGDIWEVVKVLRIDTLPAFFSNDIIYANKGLLGEYASVNNYMLFRMFDITRTVDDFIGWRGEQTKLDLSENTKLYGELTISEGDGSFSRGFQTEKFSFPKQTFVDVALGRDSLVNKKYEKFIAQDWKNGKISEISCDPRCLASYFVVSDLPYQTTPAFFKPEVILKYKGDRDKYTLDDSTISCRGAWYLQSYGVNEAGQVFTYLCYLGGLPHTEQLHWKQFNEKPKAPISEKAFARDFKGEWSDFYEPLPSIKYKLTELYGLKVGWWVLPSNDVLEKVQYPYSHSRDDWENEIMNLHQLMVEGFSKKWLTRKAKELGMNPEAKFGSILLVEQCLIGFGFDEEHANKIMSPYYQLNKLRNKLKAHVSGNESSELSREALEEFESYCNHYKNLCKDLDESLDILISAFKE